MIEIRPSGIPLRDWVVSHEPDNDLLWGGGLGRQVGFVGNRLLPLVGSGFKYEQMKEIATVISTHTSKSVELPVYQLTRPDNSFQIVLRDNFHDWKMSVISEAPIQPDFAGLFHTTPPIDPEYTGDDLHPVYFEGFPEELIFPYYSQTDGRQFSAALGHDEEVWTAVFLMMRSLGHIKPKVWHTAESHAAELALSR